MEDKLTLFRQQAAIIARKKESTAEKLNDVRVELAAIDDEVKEKKSGELLILCLNNDFFYNFTTCFWSKQFWFWILKIVQAWKYCSSEILGLAAYAGESVPLRGDDFKRYVNSLRGKVYFTYI